MSRIRVLYEKQWIHFLRGCHSNGLDRFTEIYYRM